MLKTYLEGLGGFDTTSGPRKSLGTVYGSVAGLAVLGDAAVESVLLGRLPSDRLGQNYDLSSSSASVSDDEYFGKEHLRLLLVQTIGEKY